MATCESPEGLEPQKSIVSSPLSNRSSQFKQGALKQRQMHSALQVSRIGGNKALFNMFFVSKRQQLQMKKKEAAREVRRALQEKKERAKKEHEDRGRQLERKMNGISTMQEEYLRLMEQQQTAQQKNDSSLRLPELQGPNSSTGRILVHSESPGSNKKKKTKRNKKRKTDQKESQRKTTKKQRKKKHREGRTQSQIEERSSGNEYDSEESEDMEEDEQTRAARHIRVKSQAAVQHKKRNKKATNQYFSNESSDSYQSDYQELEEGEQEEDRDSDTYVEDNQQLVKRDKRLKRELKKERRQGYKKESYSFDSRRDLERKLKVVKGEESQDSERPTQYILRGPNGEVIFKQEASFGSNEFEEFKTVDLKDRKFFTTEQSGTSGDMSQFIRTERDITGGKRFFRMDPNTGQMIRMEIEEEKSFDLKQKYRLPNICSPREESKKLKIKMPHTLKQRMQHKKASLEQRTAIQSNFLSLNRKLYHNVEPRVLEQRTPSEAISLLDDFQLIRKSARKLKARSQARSPEPKKEINPLIVMTPETSMSGVLPQKTPTQESGGINHPSQIVAPQRLIRPRNQFPSNESPASSVSNRKSREFSSSTNYSSSVDSLKSTPMSRNNLQARHANPLYKRALERVSKAQNFVNPFTYEPSSEQEHESDSLA